MIVLLIMNSYDSFQFTSYGPGYFYRKPNRKKKQKTSKLFHFLSILTAYNHLLEILVTVLYTQGCK